MKVWLVASSAGGYMSVLHGLYYTEAAALARARTICMKHLNKVKKATKEWQERQKSWEESLILTDTPRPKAWDDPENIEMMNATTDEDFLAIAMRWYFTGTYAEPGIIPVEINEDLDILFYSE